MLSFPCCPLRCWWVPSCPDRMTLLCMRDEVAFYRAVSRGACLCGGRDSGQRGGLLHGLAWGRSVEDGRRRRGVDSDMPIRCKVASIGAIVVAPSSPDTIYVGTGDVSMVGSAANIGTGVYKSTDAGHSWTHVGLEETEHIGTMWVDPANANVVVVAALGKTISKNPNRGIFKTTDGGKTWKKTLYIDDVTGAIDVTFANDNPRLDMRPYGITYTNRPTRQDLINGSSGGAIYKTTDGGETWNKIVRRAFLRMG